MAKIEYNLGELADKAQVSRRTVRFYIALGLISPPLGRGRGRHYTDVHLQEILTVRRLQARGISLGQIQRHGDVRSLESSLAEPPPPELQIHLATRITLEPGVVLEFDHDTCERTPTEMQDIARRCREALTPGERKT
ncbi:MAG: MerR family transcriptional regulator [Deltaproteobacteria bacterium]|nr:MerR family transcriptional regulator [Deltaproteobacteria bacterium]